MITQVQDQTLHPVTVSLLSTTNPLTPLYASEPISFLPHEKHTHPQNQLPGKAELPIPSTAVSRT